jgi:predicted phage terminase large subunit-like protein
LVAPNAFTPGVHIDLICDLLEMVASGRERRVLINIPPRYGKTLLCSVLFLAWLWLTRPEMRFLTASYSHDLATRDSLTMRRLVSSEWYQERWLGRARLVDDQAAKARYDTSRGGSRVAVSVGGSATGEGGDVIVLDDPLKIEHAHSAAQRESVIEWFNTTLMTRLNDPATSAVIVIGQRLHENDLFGHLLAVGGWTHICLPAEYDLDHPFRYPLDPRCERGELLWPERWQATDIDQEKRRLGSARAASMLQQLPAPLTGMIIQRHWWVYYGPTLPLPRFDVILQSWDLAFTDTASADYVVGQVWGITGADRYLLRQVRQRLSFTDTLTAIRTQTDWVNATFPQAYGHQILVEQAANGSAVIDYLRRESKIQSIIAVIPEGDKINRAHAVCPQIEAGNVYLPGAPNHDHTGCDPSRTESWVQDLIEEAATFPNGTNDDQVDALSQALRRAPNPANQIHVSSPANLPSFPRYAPRSQHSILDNPRWQPHYLNHRR